jgi:hypothetical protein
MRGGRLKISEKVKKKIKKKEIVGFIHKKRL